MDVIGIEEGKARAAGGGEGRGGEGGSVARGGYGKPIVSNLVASLVHPYFSTLFFFLRSASIIIVPVGLLLLADPVEEDGEVVVVVELVQVHLPVDHVANRPGIMRRDNYKKKERRG
jgi:hypothetical protein